MTVTVRGREGGRTSSELDLLIAACQQARAAARRVVSRSSVLCQSASAAQQQARQIRLASRAGSRYAIVEGTVEGRPSVAVVRRDGTIVADRPLRKRVELVVSLGDTFGEGRIEASIGQDPLISTLSTARAYDSVTSIDVLGARAPRRAAERPLSKNPDPTSLSVTVQHAEEGVILVLAGEVDVGCSQELAAALGSCEDGDEDVTVDLSKVSFLDAGGVSMFVVAHRKLAMRGHRLVVRGATRLVRRTFALCGLSELFLESGGE